MHDHRPILNARVRRHLGERIRPAEYRVVAPLEVVSHALTGVEGRRVELALRPFQLVTLRRLLRRTGRPPVRVTGPRSDRR